MEAQAQAVDTATEPMEMGQPEEALAEGWVSTPSPQAEPSSAPGQTAAAEPAELEAPMEEGPEPAGADSSEEPAAAVFSPEDLTLFRIPGTPFPVPGRAEPVWVFPLSFDDMTQILAWMAERFPVRHQDGGERKASVEESRAILVFQAIRACRVADDQDAPRAFGLKDEGWLRSLPYTVIQSLCWLSDSNLLHAPERLGANARRLVGLLAGALTVGEGPEAERVAALRDLAAHAYVAGGITAEVGATLETLGEA